MVFTAYFLKKELGESVDDDYPWAKWKHYCACMKKEADELKKEQRKAESKR